MQDANFSRRRYPRVKAPVLFRSSRMFARRTPVVDIGMGGMRVYSDDAFKVGQVLDIELLLPAGHTLSCQVRVVWMGLLEANAPAKFDVGLELMSVRNGQLGLLAQALEPAIEAAAERHVA